MDLAESLESPTSTPDDDVSSRTFATNPTNEEEYHAFAWWKLFRRGHANHDDARGNRCQPHRHDDDGCCLLLLQLSLLQMNELIFVIFQSDFKCFLLQYDMTNTH